MLMNGLSTNLVDAIVCVDYKVGEHTIQGLEMALIRELFSSSDVMKAAGIDGIQFQNWLKSTAVKSVDSGNIVRIHSQGVKGKERSFTYYALMTFAVAKSLSDLQLPPKRAFELALRCSASNDIWGGSSREIGLPCHPRQGTTYLVSDGENDALVTRLDGEDWDDVFSKAPLLNETRAPARLAVNISELFEKVMTNLDRDPNDYLNKAYPEDAS